MAGRTGLVAVAAAILATIGGARSVHADSGDSLTAPPPETRRVRTADPALAALMIEAAALSETFRGLVETIDASNGLVYVEPGECGHGVQACLVFRLVVAGPHRVLRILVDAGKAPVELMGSIGHELRHAIEVLSDPRVDSDADVYFFYSRGRRHRQGAFETKEATAAGRAVRVEVRRARAATK